MQIFCRFHLDLNKESHKSYIKPEKTIRYVPKNSNHPKNIIKDIPKIIEARLNTLSSNQNEFDVTKDRFQKSLREAGYKHTIEYKPQAIQNERVNRKRHKHILWWNPPYNSECKTKIGKIFFELLKNTFQCITNSGKLLIKTK